jgi:hypothetical protein
MRINKLHPQNTIFPPIAVKPGKGYSSLFKAISNGGRGYQPPSKPQNFGIATERRYDRVNDSCQTARFISNPAVGKNGLKYPAAFVLKVATITTKSIPSSAGWQVKLSRLAVFTGP